MTLLRRDPDLEVTVVVVSYNHARFVAEALDSVVAQTTPPVQIIVVDDASPDDSVGVIEQWLSRHRHPDVRTVFHAANTGLARGLNEVLDLIATPFYTVMAADDRMLPTRLEKQVARWQLHPDACAVYSNAWRITEDGQRLEPDYGTINDWAGVRALEGKVHTDLLRHNWLPAASVLLRTSSVRGVGGYNEDWFIEDHDMWLRLAATGADILCVDEPLVEVREVASSLGTTNFGADRPRHLAARLGILLDQLGVSEEGDAYIRSVVPHLASRLWRAGERPDVVARAMQTPGMDSPWRWRLTAALVGLGVSRDPRAVVADLTRSSFRRTRR